MQANSGLILARRLVKLHLTPLFLFSNVVHRQVKLVSFYHLLAFNICSVGAAVDILLMGWEAEAINTSYRTWGDTLYHEICDLFDLLTTSHDELITATVPRGGCLRIQNVSKILTTFHWIVELAAGQSCRTETLVWVRCITTNWVDHILFS